MRNIGPGPDGGMDGKKLREGQPPVGQSPQRAREAAFRVLSHRIASHPDAISLLVEAAC